MTQTKNVFRADEFAPGSVLSVVGISDYQAFTVNAITFSAVHITKSDGTHGTISCATPCVEYVKKIVEPVAVVEKVPVVVIEKVKEVKPEVEKVGTGQRGRPQGVQGKIIMDKLADFVFPTEPFTMKTIVELTGIDQLHLFPYIQKNCEVVGVSEKVEGKKGPRSKLYQVKK